MSIRRKLILLYLSPFLVQILLIVPSFFVDTDLPALQFLFNLLIPFFLLIFSTDLAFERNKNSFLISGILILLISLLLEGISYLSWGIDTGLLLNPDSETLLLAKYELYWVIIVSITGSIICQFVLLHRFKVHKK